MESIAVIIVTMAVSALSSPHGLALTACEEDHECSENMFCYKMRSCVECYNCALYYRKPNSKKMCAREPSECGECIDGYEADILTSGDERDYCRVEEKAALVGPAPSTNFTTILIVGGVIVAIVVIIAGYVIHRWRKIRYREVHQPVQNMQESHHAGSGNGTSPLLRNVSTSPLLRNVNERKPSLAEPAVSSRPSAPPPPQPSPPPPPYDSSMAPLGNEAVFVTERLVKRQEDLSFREPNLEVPSFPVEESDDQSTDGSDVDVAFAFHPDINFETGYPLAAHEEDTTPASAYGNDEPMEQSELNSPPNAEGPSFLGVLTNTGVNNSAGGRESRDMNDSGLSRASSSVSVSSLSADEGNPKCDTSNTSETLHTDGCRLEHRPMKRSGGQREEEGAAPDAAGSSVDDTLLRLAGPSCGVSRMSQASSSASLSSNPGLPHDCSEGPVAKKQKFDSGNSSTAEDLQDEEEPWRPQESPRINVQAVTVLNVQNVVNYNIQNNFNSP